MSQVKTDGLWVHAFRQHALTLQSMCVVYSIGGLSIDAPPYDYEVARVKSMLAVLPEQTFGEIAALGSHSKEKLHKQAASMRDEGTINDDETIVAIMMLAASENIMPAPVSTIGVF